MKYRTDRQRPSLPLLMCVTLSVVGLTGCGQSSTTDAVTPESAGEGAAANGLAEAAGSSGAKITAVTGPGGVTSPTLAPGTFLGKDAALAAGQVVQTPKGTLAEIALADGRRIRMNEDTALTLPGSDDGVLTLSRGELVVIAGKAGDADVQVAAAGDLFSVHSGEAQIRSVGDARRFAVVHGHATVTTPEKNVELAAGQSIETPLPADTPAPKPELSLRSLDDTGWARTFDAAARMADAVPRGVGSLTARRAGAQTEQQKLRLTDHAVTVNISGRIAHTEVEQAFFNDEGSVLEGIYRFPMPGDASMSGLGLLVGNNWMQGEIVEKQRARQIFSQIVDATIPRDPALLEWERGNIFKLRIFPIPGRGERRVRLSYTQVLPVVGGKLRYRYPMGGTGATGTPIDNFAFTVQVDGAQLDPDQLANISTPMLALERTDKGQIVELHTERDHFLPTFDLGVDVPVTRSEALVHSSTHLDRDGQAYFMVAMQPEFELEKSTESRPVHYAFVLDRSHSTTPELWTTARGVVDALTELMDRDDRFTVLACDTACDEHSGGLEPAQSEAVERAQRFLTNQDLAGASDVAGSLMQARDALARAGGEAEQVIVYLGDGVPTSGEMSTDGLHSLLKTELPDTRVLAVALGARSDLTALGAVVSATGGDLVQADSRDDLRLLVRELRLRAEVPALRDVEFELPDGMALVREQNATAVRPGDTVLLTGKLSRPVNGKITMRATGPNGPIETSVDVSLSATRETASEVNKHLPRTWAQMQVAHLTKTKGFAAKDEIVALSKAYNVLSRHTALLVLENDAMFREFNVVRAAKNTDKWGGEIDSAKERARDEESTPTDDNAPSTTAPLGAAAVPEPDPEPADLSQRAAKGDARGVDEIAEGSARDKDAPAPTSAPRRVVGGNAPPPPTEPAPAGEFSETRDDRRNSKSEAPAEEIEPELGDVDDEDERSAEVGQGPGASARPRAPLEKKSTASSKPKPSKAPAADAPWNSDPMGGLGTRGTGRGGGGSSSSSWEEQNRRRSGWRAPVRRLKVATGVAPSARGLAQISSLRAAVQADPTKRSAHGQLVRTALREGHSDALDFARAWAEVDPDHGNALRSLADALAFTGDPLAARAYESVVEILPFSASEHADLASAFENKGDFVRSCSHRRAVVSIEPASAANQAELVACLQRAGRIREATRASDVFVAGGATTSDQLVRSRELDAKVAASKLALHSGAQLRATLTWGSGAEDLDITVVDSKGRRLSTLHPAQTVRVLEGRGSEELTMRRVSRSVFIEITRRGLDPGAEDETGADTRPIIAQLQLRAGGSTKTIPVSVGVGTERVAKVFWSF